MLPPVVNLAARLPRVFKNVLKPSVLNRTGQRSVLPHESSCGRGLQRGHSSRGFCRGTEENEDIPLLCSILVRCHTLDHPQPLPQALLVDPIAHAEEMQAPAGRLQPDDQQLHNGSAGLNVREQLPQVRAQSHCEARKEVEALPFDRADTTRAAFHPEKQLLRVHPGPVPLLSRSHGVTVVVFAAFLNASICQVQVVGISCQLEHERIDVLQLEHVVDVEAILQREASGGAPGGDEAPGERGGAFDPFSQPAHAPKQAQGLFAEFTRCRVARLLVQALALASKVAPDVLALSGQCASPGQLLPKKEDDAAVLAP
mmetsp:Transcript_4636/g.11686  ORF Transcript_4636/g.11686 Transcript_4636/m.11686 type:complete len:314 (-) Transcript_4636:188-1129(-)